MFVINHKACLLTPLRDYKIRPMLILAPYICRVVPPLYHLVFVPSEMLHKIDVIREKKDLVFIMANGQRVTRSVGFAIIKIEEYFTIDEVVFGEEGDMLLLGARTLEGLNLTVDSRLKKLVAAGPLLVAYVR